MKPTVSLLLPKNAHGTYNAACTRSREVAFYDWWKGRFLSHDELYLCLIVALRKS